MNIVTKPALNRDGKKVFVSFLSFEGRKYIAEDTDRFKCRQEVMEMVAKRSARKIIDKEWRRAASDFARGELQNPHKEGCPEYYAYDLAAFRIGVVGNV